LTGVLVFYMVPSCNDAATSKESNDKPDSVAAVAPPPPSAILIVGSDASSGDLDLRDNAGHPREVSRARSGEVINWIVQPGSGVKSIESIALDPSVNNNFDVFEEPPHPLGPLHWQGRIKSSFPGSSHIYTEKYLIKWTHKKTPPRTHIYDPFIQVNPAKLTPGTDSSGTEQ
jgi:hypothetical protein